MVDCVRCISCGCLDDSNDDDAGDDGDGDNSDADDDDVYLMMIIYDGAEEQGMMVVLSLRLDSARMD
jgi:hypothetical protein